MSWQKSNPQKLRDLREQLQKMKALVQAQKVRELDKLERVLEVFDTQTQDVIRKATNAQVD